MIKDPKVEKALEDFVKAIEESREFTEFNEKRIIASNDEELRSKIQRSRVIREQLNNMSEYEKDTPMTENLVEEYDRIMDTTAVHEFSIKELEFCNLYRDVMARIVNCFNLDLKAGE